MPSFANVVIADSVPTNHTFKPHSIDTNGVARLVESDGTPIGDNVLTVAARKTLNKYKCRLVLQMPKTVTETINGVTRETVENVAFGDVNLTFDQSSTPEERKNLIRLLSNALAGDTMIDGVLVDLEGVWG